MTYCNIANDIALNADEPEQLVASEVYQMLCQGRTLCIDNDFYELNDFSEYLMEDSEALLDAVQESITTNPLALHTLYIEAIAATIGD